MIAPYPGLDRLVAAALDADLDTAMRAFNGTADDRRIWAKTQTMGVYTLGIQGIAIITQSSQNEDASGGDTNAPTQTNPVTTTAGK